MMAVTPLSPAGFADYLELLRILDEREAEALIVGGQAVNFWAEVFEAEEPELRQYRPFTSADLDLHRPDLAAKRLLRARAGSVETDRDPFGKAFTLVSHTFFIQGKAGAVLLCTAGRKITSVSRAHGFALLQTVPLAALRRSRHPKLISFVAKRLPGWQQSLGSSGIP